MPTDPVCGMDVEEGSPLHHDHAGTTYYFCNPGCLKKFQENPGKYLEPEKAVEKEAPPPGDVRIYTCPMDPEVEQVGPGVCPKCGMALEPKEVTAEEEDQGEYRDMLFRFKACAALSLPLLVLTMGREALGLSFPSWTSGFTGEWIQAASLSLSGGGARYGRAT